MSCSIPPSSLSSNDSLPDIALWTSSESLSVAPCFLHLRYMQLLLVARLDVCCLVLSERTLLKHNISFLFKAQPMTRASNVATVNTSDKVLTVTPMIVAGFSLVMTTTPAWSMKPPLLTFSTLIEVAMVMVRSEVFTWCTDGGGVLPRESTDGFS